MQHRVQFAACILFVVLSACSGGGAGIGTSPASLDGISNALPASAPTTIANAADVATAAITKQSTQYPIYSSSFTGNTPFHHTVAALMSSGAWVLSSTIAQHYWSEGIFNSQPSNQSGGVGPLYTAAWGQPTYRFSCPGWGHCSADGLIVHFPWGAQAQTGPDHHLSSFDPVFLHGEVDGWGGHSGEQCGLWSGSPGGAGCTWGGFYPFSGSGLPTVAGNSANAGGYAFGLMDITAQELLQGHIDHALGIAESCLDDGGVYPATAGRASDAHCPWNLEPNAKYGQMIHLKSWVNTYALGLSPYCRVIVQALQNYGAYTADNNGGYGISVELEFMTTYTGTNPWYQTIFPSMAAGGDGSGYGADFRFHSCLDKIPVSDIEVIQISQNLPPNGH